MSRRPKDKPGQKKAATKASGLPASSATENHPAGLNERWTVAGISAFLVLITFVVFGQTLHDQFVNYDDNIHVFDNAAVKSGLTWKSVAWAFTFSRSDYWHPLDFLSHMLDTQIYGLAPAGHHLTNVLLHATGVVLLFLVLRKMTGALWRSAFVAALFAIHPLRVESVAWVSERKDMLHGIFFMLTVWAYVHYVRHSWSLKRYLAVVLLFLCGLMSKPTLMTLPFVLLLLDYWPLNRFGLVRNDAHGITLAWWQSNRPVIFRVLVEKLPLFILSAASCAQAAIGNSPAFNINKAIPETLQISNAVVSYVIYLWQMICPIRLAVMYPFPAAGLPFWEVMGALSLLVFVSAISLILRRRHPYFLVGWLWYLGMLVPMIGFIQAGNIAHADRYTYLPQIGLYIALTWAAVDLCSGRRHCRLVLGGIATAILAALIPLARTQAAYWQNSKSLWVHTLACTSDNYTAYYCLGNAMFDEGDMKGAIAHYQTALQINPDYPDAQNNLGNALLKTGDVDGAIAHYQKALQTGPGNAAAQNNLGNALIKKGNVDEAILHYQTALQIKPDNIEACINLGDALLKKGNLDEAIACYRKALQVEPDNLDVHYSLGNALLQKGDLDEAIFHYRKALPARLGDAEAHNNFGYVLFRMGSVDEAIAHYQKALQINPDYAEAHNNLGNALLQKGSTDEAIAHYQKALQINPNDADAHNNLGNAFLQKGNAEKAIAHYQQALQIRPNYLQVQNNLAWVLATAPQATLRNGARAVDLAQQANQLAGGKDPIILHTLAAAYAEVGRFNDARRSMEKAIELAQAVGRPDMLKQFNAELGHYEAGLPFHQESK